MNGLLRNFTGAARGASASSPAAEASLIPESAIPREDKKKRNTRISVCKGIAIILMVIGHAEAPGFITLFIYAFHMPLFFITAGYFFTARTADDPWRFCARRFKGLYIPFLKWSIFFLLLHNVLFYFGILNETYGNWTGGVTHPYSLHTAGARLMMMLTGMAGYDEFPAGAFWFFRGLLVASIMFLILYRLMPRRLGHVGAAIAVAVCAWAFTAWHIGSQYRISTIPNGGWREVWGIFFFAMGVVFRHIEPRIRTNIWLALLCMGMISVGTLLPCHGMNNHGVPNDLWTLPLTGIAGFLMTYYFSGLIDRHEGRLKRFLVFAGDNTLYVLVFHVISFKLVSLLKIHWYDLDFRQIGCHMVIHDFNDDLFWILYSVVGVGVPLLGIYLYRRAAAAISRVKAQRRVSLSE